MAAQASEIQLPFQPGDRCGEFRIVKLLGHGGAGAVYEAEHPWMGARVAVKALYRTGGDYAQRMELEAKTLAQIHHRHVVRVFSGGVTEQNVVWFAMDLLRGESLTAVLERDDLEVARALRYAIEIADGVAAAHALGVIHRDLKPENVFILAPEDEVRVLDLGTAKFKRGSMKSTDRFRFIGTYAYAAPERLLGNSSTAATDVYSFGLVLYEMLAGRHCWSRGPKRYDLPPLEELGSLQMHGRPESIRKHAPEVPKALDRYIRKQLLHKDSDRRPQAMLDVAAQLREFAARCPPERQRSRELPVLPRPSGEVAPQPLTVQVGWSRVTREAETDEQRVLASTSTLPTGELPFALATTEESRLTLGNRASVDRQQDDRAAGERRMPTEVLPFDSDSERAQAVTRTAPNLVQATPDTLPGIEGAAWTEREWRKYLAPSPDDPFSLEAHSICGAMVLVLGPHASWKLLELVGELLALEQHCSGLVDLVQKLLSGCAGSRRVQPYIRSLFELMVEGRITEALLLERDWLTRVLPAASDDERARVHAEAYQGWLEGVECPAVRALAPPERFRRLALEAMFELAEELSREDRLSRLGRPSWVRVATGFSELLLDARPPGASPKDYADMEALSAVQTLALGPGRYQLAAAVTLMALPRMGPRQLVVMKQRLVQLARAAKRQDRNEPAPETDAEDAPDTEEALIAELTREVLRAIPPPAPEEARAPASKLASVAARLRLVCGHPAARLMALGAIALIVFLATVGLRRWIMTPSSGGEGTAGQEPHSFTITHDASSPRESP